MKNKLGKFLIFGILILGFALRMYKINNEIADWHSWRQVDTASVTKFLLKDREILTPKYFDLSNIQTGHENPKGYRFVEFPIFNIFHALIYTYSTLSFEGSGRMVSILAALTTGFFLYLIGKKLQGRKMGLLAAFFYLTLPYNIYFTRVILPGPLAVCFSIASIYLFMIYLEKDKNKFLFISAILLSLAILTKPHSIFFAIPMLFLTFQKYGFRKSLQKIPLYIALDIALVPFFLWRAWMNYGDHYVGIPHFAWSLNGNHIRFKPAFWRWIFGERIGKLILGYWGLIPFGIGVLYRKTHILISLLCLSSFLYLSVFASANVMHDYYQIFIIPSISLAVASGFITLNQRIYSNKYVSLFISIIILVVMYSTSLFYIKDNYNINDYRALDAARYVDQNLPLDAKVIAPYNGDTMFLYHTNRSGWPVVTTDIDSMIRLGADYYVSTNLSDQDTLEFSSRFETVYKNDQFVILNLRKEL